MERMLGPKLQPNPQLMQLPMSHKGQTEISKYIPCCNRLYGAELFPFFLGGLDSGVDSVNL